MNRSSSSAGTQRAPCRVTVAAAVDALLLRLLKLVIVLCTWLESVGEWVETYDAAGHLHLCTQLRQLQFDAIDQLLKVAAADVRGTRMMLPPFPLLELYCCGMLGFYTADQDVMAPNNCDDLPRLRKVLPDSVSDMV